MGLQARLQEIISSNTESEDTDGCLEAPWMVDGAAVPSNASQLLPKMVFCKLSLSKFRSSVLSAFYLCTLFIIE